MTAARRRTFRFDRKNRRAPHMIAATGSGFVPSFSPAALFGASDTGAVYDASNLASMFQLSNGTTAVAADGDPVGYITDLSGKGNHAIQATAGARPQFKTSGGLSWLESTAGDRFMIATLTAGVAQPSTIGIAYHYITISDSDIVDIADATDTGATRNLIGVRTSNLVIYAGTGLVGATAESTVGNHIAIGEFNGASSSLSRDNAAAATGNAGTGAPSLGHKLALFINTAGAAEAMIGRIHAVVYINRLLTAGEKTNLTAWLNSKVGL